MGIKTELIRGLGKRLLAWSISSFTIGVILFFSPFPLIRGIGLQGLLWGIIDAIIAVFTLFKQKNQPIVKLTRILIVNVALDIGYQIIGFSLIVLMWQDAFISGNGIGVIFQGAFLFVLDLYYYIQFKHLPLDEAV